MFSQFQLLSLISSESYVMLTENRQNLYKKIILRCTIRLHQVYSLVLANIVNSSHLILLYTTILIHFIYYNLNFKCFIFNYIVRYFITSFNKIMYILFFLFNNKKIIFFIMYSKRMFVCSQFIALFFCK